MPKYSTVPLSQLKSDVAVDEVHVRELEDSIKAMGQVQPLLIRENDLSIMDGFHRAKAMEGLGFEKAEAILWDCRPEEFWDLRIMSAVLHKNVTFARAVDWIEVSFATSPIASKHKSAYLAFHAVRAGFAKPDVREWVYEKARKWGLAVSTIEGWLQTKGVLAPELYSEAKGITSEEGLSLKHYQQIARSLPTNVELQRVVLDKVKREGLTSDQTRDLAKAIRHADDERERQTILREPMSRTAEDLTRAAKVEKILAEPVRQPTPREQQYELTGLALEVYLGLQQQVYNVRRLTPQALEALMPRQRHELLQVVEQLTDELQRLSDSLRGIVEGRLIKGG